MNTSIFKWMNTEKTNKIDGLSNLLEQQWEWYLAMFECKERVSETERKVLNSLCVCGYRWWKLDWRPISKYCAVLHGLLAYNITKMAIILLNTFRVVSHQLAVWSRAICCYVYCSGSSTRLVVVSQSVSQRASFWHCLHSFPTENIYLQNGVMLLDGSKIPVAYSSTFSGMCYANRCACDGDVAI